MIYTENKPIEEILDSLGKEKNIFLLACNGCAETCETGGAKALSVMKTDLENGGKNIKGTALVDFLCNKLLVATRLARDWDTLKQADSILALTCGLRVCLTGLAEAHRTANAKSTKIPIAHGS